MPLMTTDINNYQHTNDATIWNIIQDLVNQHLFNRHITAIMRYYIIKIPQANDTIFFNFLTELLNENLITPEIDAVLNAHQP